MTLSSWPQLRSWRAPETAKCHRREKRATGTWRSALVSLGGRRGCYQQESWEFNAVETENKKQVEPKLIIRVKKQNKTKPFRGLAFRICESFWPKTGFPYPWPLTAFQTQVTFGATQERTLVGHIAQIFVDERIWNTPWPPSLSPHHSAAWLIPTATRCLRSACVRNRVTKTLIHENRFPGLVFIQLQEQILFKCFWNVRGTATKTGDFKPL